VLDLGLNPIHRYEEQDNINWTILNEAREIMEDPMTPGKEGYSLEGGTPSSTAAQKQTV